MNKYKEILDLFKSEDELRQWMCKPFFYKDYAIATDGSTLVFFDKSLYPDLNPGQEDKMVVMDKILSYEPSHDFEITKEDFQKIIDACPVIEEMESNKIKCDACNGEGRVDFEFQHDGRYYETKDDCPVCDGEGETGTEKPTGKMIKDFSKRIQLKQSTLAVEFIQRLFKVVEILDEKVILKSQAGRHAKSVFKVGNVTVLIMPILSEYEENIIYKL